MIGIYKITNKINGKSYIGKANNIQERWRIHVRDLNANKHFNIYLQRSWNKHGEENFEFSVLEECDEINLNNEEIYWISYYNSNDSKLGYNLTLGGDGGSPMKGKHHSDKTKKAMSEKRKKENNNFYGKHHTDEAKNKISIANTGSYCGEKSVWYGSHHSEESKAKMRSSWIKNGNTRSVYQLDAQTFEIINRFKSLSEATTSLGISRSSIKNVLSIKYRNKTASGFCWEYTDEINIKYNKKRSEL